MIWSHPTETSFLIESEGLKDLKRESFSDCSFKNFIVIILYLFIIYGTFYVELKIKQPSNLLH